MIRWMKNKLYCRKNGHGPYIVQLGRGGHWGEMAVSPLWEEGLD